MPELRSYPRDQLPRDLAIQQRAYMRMQWPTLAPTDTSILPRPYPCIDFVLTEGDLLISHASVNWRTLPHADQSWHVYGLSGVFTYPDHRRAGHAATVVRAATQYILAQNDADLALLFCAPRLEPFYTAAGWSPAPGAHILYGNPASPTRKTDNLTMALYVSDRARDAEPLFETHPFYVGESTW